MPGGIETFCADLHRALPGVGVESHVIAHGKPGTSAPAGETRLTLVRTLGEWLFTPIAPAFRRRFERLIRSLQPDLIHFHLPNPSAFWALTSGAARRLPWLIQWHSDVVASAGHWRLRLAYPLYAPWERMMLRRAERILLSSQAYLDASAPLAAFRARCEIVPLGLDPDRLRAVGDLPSAWQNGRFRVLAIGRLTHYKGFEVLIEALARVDAAELVLVGSGRLEAVLRRVARRFGVADRVSIRTAAGDAERNALLNQCDCLCLPSIERTEAFGLVLVEAMARGKPVVATDLAGSGMPEVVRLGGHGLLAAPGSADDLARQLTRLAADPALARELGERGQESFERRFHIRHAAWRIAEIYAGILNGPGGSQ